VVGDLVGGEDAESDILAAAPLDPREERSPTA
jgi:hypothetical protein